MPYFHEELATLLLLQAGFDLISPGDYRLFTVMIDLDKKFPDLFLL